MAQHSTCSGVVSGGVIYVIKAAASGLWLCKAAAHGAHHIDSLRQLQGRAISLSHCCCCSCTSCSPAQPANGASQAISRLQEPRDLATDGPAVITCYLQLVGWHQRSAATWRTLLSAHTTAAGLGKVLGAAQLAAGT